MAPASNEEQFKFLISCIRYSNNGKVDFGQVAKECGIVTKGAAAKRYERLMRAHGINSNPSSIKPSTPTKSKPERKESTPSKKRKLADVEDAQKDGADDDENFGPLTQTPTIKSETRKPLARLTPHSIKAEDKDTPKSSIMTSSPIPLHEAADLMQFYPDGTSQTFSEASFSSTRDINDYASGNDYSSNFGGPTTPSDNNNEGPMFGGFNPFNSAYPDNDPLNIFAPGFQSNVRLQAPVVPSNAAAMMNPLPAPRPQMASQVFGSSQLSSPFGSTGFSDNPVVLE